MTVPISTLPSLRMLMLFTHLLPSNGRERARRDFASSERKIRQDCASMALSEGAF